MSSHPQCIPQNFIHFGLYELEVPAGTDDPAGTMFFFYTQWCDKAKKKKTGVSITSLFTWNKMSEGERSISNQTNKILTKSIQE